MYTTTTTTTTKREYNILYMSNSRDNTILCEGHFEIDESKFDVLCVYSYNNARVPSVGERMYQSRVKMLLCV